jgi:hypothetical protein
MPNLQGGGSGGGGGGGTVDQGSPGLIGSPWPVILSDGAAPLGTVANPVNVNLASGDTAVVEQGTAAAVAGAWPMKVTDGTNIQSVSAAGAAKVDGSAVTQPISAASLPLPANAATETTVATLATQATLATRASEATLATRVADATITARLGVLGQASMAASAPVVIASDQASIPVAATLQAGAATVGKVDQGTGGASAWKVDGSAVTQPVSGTFWQATQPVSGSVTANAGTNLNTSALSLEATQTAMSAKLPATLGQKAMAASMAVVIASDQSAVPVSGSVTANAGTNLNTSLLALASTQTDGTQLSRVTDGTNTAKVLAASTAAVASDKALVVAISPNNTPVLPTNAATETSLAKLTLAQGSTTSGQSGALAQGAVTTAAPSYTTAQTSPLSLTTAGDLRVVDSRLPTALGQTTAANSLPVVMPSNTPLATSGGSSVSKTISAATTNATSVKASAGQVWGIVATNVNANPRFLKLYNKASAPTVGTDVPTHTYLIPGNTVGAGISVFMGEGSAFSTGIALAITGAVADNDTTAVAANEIVVNLRYS